MNSNNIPDNSPVGVLCDPANLESKIQLVNDTMSRLLDDTAEITDPTELADVVDLVRNLNELAKQLINIQQSL